MKFDLNVEKYNIDDMLDIFNIKKTDNLNKLILDNQYNNIIIGIQNSNLNINDRDSMENFLLNVYKKLLILINHDDTRLLNKPKIFSKTYNIGMHNVIEPNNDSKKYINHINNTEVCKLLNINTRFRKNYTIQPSSDFSFELSNMLKNVISMSLLSIQIPKYISYTISSKLKTNEFTINFYTWDTDNNEIDGDMTNYILKIPDGNYTGIELKNYFNDILFDNNDDDLDGIKCDYNINTNKLIFLRDIDGLAEPGNGKVYRFNIDWRLNDNMTQPIQLNLGWILGYRKSQYIWLDDYIITSTNEKMIGFNPECIYLGYSQYYMLAIDDFNNNHTSNLISPFQESMFNDNNILAKIPINNDNLNYEDLNEQPARLYFGPVNINKFKVRLLDEFGRVLDLNNGDYSFTLKIKQLYDITAQK